MNQRRKKRLYIVLFVLLGISAMVGLMLVALKENMNMFFTPTQFERQEVPQGPVVRVGGLVVPGSMKRSAETLRVEFDLTDNRSVVTVRYEKILPDLFREGQGIVAKGVWDGEVVVAQEVLAKHDETYMPPEVKAALEEAGHPVE